MNNMRRGFTLIELIFVILIIGILAAVALPRFLESATQAHNAKVDAFVGTLNRTVGPTLWAKSINDTAIAVADKGKIVTYCAVSNLSDHVDIPEEVDVSAACVLSLATNGGATLTTFTFVDGTATKAPAWTYVP